LATVTGALLAFPAESASEPGSASFGIGPRYALVVNRASEENSNMFGGAFRLRGSYLGFEGAANYRSEDLGGADLRTWPVSASLLVFPLSTLYALGGVGWYNSTLDFPKTANLDDRTDSPFGYHFGAGLEVPLAPGLHMTGDVRWQFVDYDFDEIPASIGKVDADAWSLNAGLLFYLP
jgi:opacity protein-like surface antigen